jgi:hypothetical protein
MIGICKVAPQHVRIPGDWVKAGADDIFVNRDFMPTLNSLPIIIVHLELAGS